MSSMSPYSTYISKSRYSKWIEKENRRENWGETVERYLAFFAPRIPKAIREETVGELREAITNMDVMPSMRAVMTAGEALEKDNIAGYNCSYLAVDDQRAFDEAMYISMCGTGVGFSVERQYINQLPVVAENFYKSSVILKVRDSKIGWATAFKELIALLYTGMIPTWDLSLVRPAGSPLKTFGGRASGPGPLDELFTFAVRLFQNAAGRKLTSLECHDLMCKVADVVVVGGVRRSAMISLSNLSDDRMRNAKNGKWWEENGHRALANNSAVYTEKPEIGMFMKEWLTLYESRSGERGIFNRAEATETAKRTGRRKWEGVEFGVNPCGEIVLRSKGLCNLTEVIVRPKDTPATLKHKVRLAAILGTLQATLTDFRYLRKDWKKNAEEERLLGVGLGGIMDNPLMSNNTPKLAALLDDLRLYVLEVNKEWAEKLGINPSVATTCVKPSGTASQLVDCSSGIHPRFSRYFMRSVRNDAKDPVGTLLKACSVPNEPDITKPNDVDVFYFPIQCPATSVCRKDLTAVQQLEIYLTYKLHWCEHNPSCTIYVRENEWLEVAAWVYKNFNEIGGVSFLPYTDHVYKQPPYAELNKEEYEKAVASFPVVDWGKLPDYEKDDRTTAMKELACSAGQCDI
jgi:ribonucleoside-triphosphate reductase (thioredoxin)